MKDESFGSQKWFLNSRTTCHMRPWREWFILYKILNPPLFLYRGDNGKHQLLTNELFKSTLRMEKSQMYLCLIWLKIWYMFVRQLLNAIVLNFFMTIVSLKKKVQKWRKKYHWNSTKLGISIDLKLTLLTSNLIC